MGRRGDDEDERALWQQVTRDAKPLKGKLPKVTNQPPAPSKPEPKPKPAAGGKTPRPAPRQTPVARSAPKTPAIDAGARADVDRRTAERLRRGKLPIERRLDLHGCREAAAEQHLAAFLAAASRDGLRCVLVITGKGEGRDGGVLRQRLPQWLNQPGNRSKVVAFAPAQIPHGGHGAFYVLLKRERKT